MHRQRIYVDTPVIGGCVDEEFAEESRSLLDLARQGEISLLLSDLLFQELEDAPASVAEIAAGLPSESYELIDDNHGSGVSSAAVYGCENRCSAL